MLDLVPRVHAVLVFNQRSVEEIFGMILRLGNHPRRRAMGSCTRSGRPRSSSPVQPRSRTVCFACAESLRAGPRAWRRVRKPVFLSWSSGKDSAWAPQGLRSDPAENGEFHTHACAGPMFRRPIPVLAGEVVHRGGFVFADLLPGPD